MLGNTSGDNLLYSPFYHVPQFVMRTLISAQWFVISASTQLFFYLFFNSIKYLNLSISKRDPLMSYFDNKEHFYELNIINFKSCCTYRKKKFIIKFF